MKIKIAFYKGKGDILNGIVRWWTKSVYSHAELVLPDGVSWIGISPFLKSKVASRKKLIIDYGKRVGFTDQELETAYDSRAVATMRKAALYDQLTQKRGTLKPVQRSSMKAGSQSVDLSSAKSKKASARLKKSGRVEDAAGVFFNMIRS